MNRLILASKSPRRKKLLQQLGLTFSVRDSQLKEKIQKEAEPVSVVEILALQKAKRIAIQSADSIVIAADTSVVLKGVIFGKPKNVRHAQEILHSLSGQTHTVVTGVCLLRTNGHAEVIDRLQFHEQTKVTFSSLTHEEIEAYVGTGSPMDKAGAYGIQDDWGAVFVSRIDGDYYNVVGFPLHAFYQHIKGFAPEVLTGTPLTTQ